MSEPAKDLKALGAGATTYKYDKPDATLLERFPNPMPVKGDALNASFIASWVKISIPEFSSLCPKTGQPDFATIIIEYRPREWCVESKALKMYGMSYRMHGEFHEACIARMAADLCELLDPLELKIEGRFTPRGGIPFWPRIHIITTA